MIEPIYYRGKRYTFASFLLSAGELLQMGQAVIPTDWDGDYCKYAVCWPSSPQWEALLRGVLTLPAYGRYWDEHTGSIIGAQQVIRETFDYNLHLQGVVMACNDEFLGNIATALEHMATAMAQGQGTTANATACCDKQGSGGSGNSDVAISTTEQGTEGVVDPPTGFSTWEEFFASKCARANDYLLEFEKSLLALQNVIFVGVEAGGIALIATILVSIAIPFEAIFALVTLLLGVVAEEVLSSAYTIMVDNHNLLLCVLYNGTSAVSSKQGFLDAISSYVDDAGLSAVNAFAVKQCISGMTSNQGINQIYEKSLVRTYVEADCSSCEASVIIWNNCTDTVQEQPSPLHLELSSVADCDNSYGCHAVHFNVETDEEGSMTDNGNTYKIVAYSFDGFTGGCYTYLGNPADYIYFNKTGAILAYGNTIDTDQCFREFFAQSTTPFTCTLTLQLC